MIARMPEVYDGQVTSEDERRGVCHISDVLPIVLARMSATAQSDTDRRTWPQDVASDIMPAPGMSAYTVDR